MRFRDGALLLIAASAAAAAAPARAGLVIVPLIDPAKEKGTLVTNDAKSYVYDDELAKWIDELIPSSANRLLVFTQCFGGNMVDDYQGKSNTAVASAGSPGQYTVYDGYHDDAAKALKPGAGTSGKSVHDAGSAGRVPDKKLFPFTSFQEQPSSGGGLPLQSFSLEPTSPSGDVQSRHVLVYAGAPRAPQDDADRDAVEQNFAGQPNTTVRSVGDKSQAGWDRPATPENLRKAIQEIGEEIAASPDPSKEQFIFFGGDHGDYHGQVFLNPVTREKFVVQPGDTLRGQGFSGFDGAKLDPAILEQAPGNRPGFSVFVPFDGSTPHPVPEALASYTPFFGPGSFSLSVGPTGGPPLISISDFLELPYELADMGATTDVLGDFPGEGVQLFFEVPESFFVASFFDVSLDLDVTNHTASPQGIQWLSQDSGEVPRMIPEPSSASLALAGLLAALTGRWRAVVSARSRSSSR
jgi:hypothetical protein